MQTMQADQAIQSKLGSLKTRALIVAATGIVLTLAGFFVDKTAFASSYLVAFLFWLGITVGCLPLVMLHHLADGGWGYPLRKVMEVILSLIPLMALAFIPIYLMLPVLYPWANAEIVAHDPIIQLKGGYLNAEGYLIRAVIYFAIWMVFAAFLTRASKAFSKTFSDGLRATLQRVSGVGIIVYALTSTFASVDWSMSLEPHWFSTIYGVLFIAGQTLLGFGFSVAAVVLLSKGEPLNKVLTTERSHDMGKLFFAFIMFWAYISLSQFIIIWNGNLAEETPWYIKRFSNGWEILSVLLPICHFFIPFLLLLSRYRKRVPVRFFRVIIFVLAVRWADLNWLIKPALYPSLNFHWLDITCFAAIGGVWLFFFLGKIQKENLVLEHDPILTGREGTGSHHG